MSSPRTGSGVKMASVLVVTIGLLVQYCAAGDVTKAPRRHLAAIAPLVAMPGFEFVTVGSGFSYPAGLAVSGGYIFVADRPVGKVKRMNVDGSNVITLSEGGDLINPFGVAVDKASGRIFVADPTARKIIRMESDGTNPLTIADRPSILDATGSELGYSYGLAVDNSGRIVIADGTGNRVMRMNQDGGNVEVLGSGFNNPGGVAVDSAGKIYVADSSNQMFKRMNSDGSNIVTLGSGWVYPFGITVHSNGDIYVADSGNSGTPAVFKRMDQNGNNIVTLGSNSLEGRGIALDSNGNVFVTDSGNSRVMKLVSSMIPIAACAGGHGTYAPNHVRPDDGAICDCAAPATGCSGFVKVLPGKQELTLTSGTFKYPFYPNGTSPIRCRYPDGSSDPRVFRAVVCDAFGVSGAGMIALV